jgi:hypothetical protein
LAHDLVDLGKIDQIFFKKIDQNHAILILKKK